MRESHVRPGLVKGLHHRMRYRRERELERPSYDLKSLPRISVTSDLQKWSSTGVLYDFLVSGT
jgi:hypothetical protein